MKLCFMRVCASAQLTFSRFALSVQDRNWQGWIAFGILMAAHLLKDSKLTARMSFAPQVETHRTNSFRFPQQ